MSNLANRWLASDGYFKQPLGVVFTSIRLISLALVALGTAIVFSCILCGVIQTREWVTFVLGTISAAAWIILTGIVVHRLNTIYSLRKQESRITLSQILFLGMIGLWLIILIAAIDPEKGGVLALAGGALLSWVFQDTIKSVVAFFYLRMNQVLNIGDWIEVEGKGIDGIVKQVNLTTVTIENWDTTTSAFPLYILYSEHFRNNQDMLEGKTYGRRMLRTFIIDTGWIHPISESEATRIREKVGATSPFAENRVKVGELNITLFREYIYQMLLSHPKVSHEPRLIVRWLEQRNEGLPLQLFIYITDTQLAAFEKQQSEITENLIEALPWFGLQLYQAASGYDASNSNIFMTEKEATYGRD